MGKLQIFVACLYDGALIFVATNLIVPQLGYPLITDRAP
jgi:hypothetical protein